MLPSASTGTWTARPSRVSTGRPSARSGSEFIDAAAADVEQIEYINPFRLVEATRERWRGDDNGRETKKATPGTGKRATERNFTIGAWRMPSLSHTSTPIDRSLRNFDRSPQSRVDHHRRSVERITTTGTIGRCATGFSSRAM